MAECPFFQMLQANWQRKGRRVCVGLDSVFDKLPERYRNDDIYSGTMAFNRHIIETTSDLALCYKLNLGAYLASGVEGIDALESTCNFIASEHPGLPFIIDQKTGDIGTSNEWYARFAFDICKAHAITVHNYTGQEAMQSLLDRKDKGFFVLCKTSNKGSNEIQMPTNLYTPRPLYEFVAQQVEGKWNANGNCGLVVGATHPEQMKEIRKQAGDLWFLVPGVGAQGGNAGEVIENGINSTSSGVAINSSSGIIFSDDPRRELIKLANEIDAKLGALTTEHT